MLDPGMSELNIELLSRALRGEPEFRPVLAIQARSFGANGGAAVISLAFSGLDEM